jgi:hypothetical protein
MMDISFVKSRLFSAAPEGTAALVWNKKRKSSARQAQKSVQGLRSLTACCLFAVVERRKFGVDAPDEFP